MENATQALLIAGGILFVILILSLMIVMFNNIATMENAKAEKKQAQELAAWNQEWEAYNKEYLYGTEVLTVINKAKQNNKEYYDNPRYTVDIEVNVSNIEIMRNSIFTCTEVIYEKGRVKKMRFEYVP